MIRKSLQISFLRHGYGVVEINQSTTNNDSDY